MVKPGNRLFWPATLGLLVYVGIFLSTYFIHTDSFKWILIGACVYNLIAFRYMIGVKHSRALRYFLPGLLYLALTTSSVHYFRYHGEDYRLDLILLLCLIWASDIGSFFFGRQFGKRPLAPTISPNKTLEGFIGGMFFASIFALAVALINQQYYMLILMAPFVHIFTAMGDLLESKLKRLNGVKDSSHLIPGHGGFLDRCDGLLFALPFALLLFDCLKN